MHKAENFARLSRLFRTGYDVSDVEYAMKEFEGVTDDEMDIACAAAKRTCKFMPTVADLLEMVMDHRAQHPTQAPMSIPTSITRDEAYRSAAKRDRQEMEMTEEEYDAFKKEYEAEHGEPWDVIYFHPEDWNDDGTQKGVG